MRQLCERQCCALVVLVGERAGLCPGQFLNKVHAYGAGNLPGKAYVRKCAIADNMLSSWAVRGSELVQGWFFRGRGEGSAAF